MIHPFPFHIISPTCLLWLCLATASHAQTSQHTFVFLHKRTDLPPTAKEQVDRLMQGHLANIDRLAKEGKLVTAGPFDGGGGIFIFNSGSVVQVQEWLATDPAIQAQRWHVEILPYYVQAGNPTLVAEPYDMVTYPLVHFKPTVSKFNVQAASEILGAQREFVAKLINTGNVVAAGWFGGLDGAIVIMRGQVAEEVLIASPAVQAALFTPEVKKLWIAKGAFGEK